MKNRDLYLSCLFGLIVLCYPVVSMNAQKKDIKQHLPIQNQTLFVDSAIISSHNIVMLKPDTIAEYMDGGFDGILKAIRGNLKRPIRIHQWDSISGRIIVRLLISEKGELVDAEIVKGIHPSFDKEALRVANLLKKWKPARKEGREIASYFILPVTFYKLE